MDIGYARVSTTKQDVTRQLDALAAAGVASEHIYMDKKSGATRNCQGYMRRCAKLAKEM
jgi:DNA invertase Pin-like site-specific DNA recombinase